MPTTTWSSMRQDILRPLGLITGSTTTNISGSNLLVKDTKISQRYPVDDYFNCVSSCDTDNKECHNECTEELKENDTGN